VFVSRALNFIRIIAISRTLIVVLIIFIIFVRWLLTKQQQRQPNIISLVMVITFIGEIILLFSYFPSPPFMIIKVLAKNFFASIRILSL
jgi:hypothetical protein